MKAANVSRAVWTAQPTASAPPGAVPTAVPVAVPTLRVAREAGLLLLVAAVTRITAADWLDTNWTAVDFSAHLEWVWIPVVGAVITTLLRRWTPAVALVVAAGLFGWWPVSGAAVAVAAFGVSGRSRSKRWRIGVLGLAALTGYVAALFSARQSVTLVTQLHLVAALVCITLPAGIRVLLTMADDVLRAVLERTHYLEENYRLAQSTARLQERSRIAQEMHDQLGHRLSLISLYAGALELASSGRDPRAGGEAQLIRSTVQTAMRELRTALGVLRTPEDSPAKLHPVEETGLRSDVARLVEESRSAGIEVHLTWRGDDLVAVPMPVRRAVHRVVREGLANVYRHAPGSQVSVVVEHVSDAVRIEVSDRQKPMEAEPNQPMAPGTGLGLTGVRERVSLLGGDFRAGPTPEDGFRLTAELPLRSPSGICTFPLTHAPSVAITRFGGKSTHTPSERWVRHGASAALATGLVGVAGLVAVTLTSLPWYVSYPSVDRPPPVKVAEVGMTRAESAPYIGPDDPLARLAARSVESPPPSGGRCVYTQDWLLNGQATIVRYCFLRDRLVDKDRYKLGGPMTNNP